MVLRIGSETCSHPDAAAAARNPFPSRLTLSPSVSLSGGRQTRGRILGEHYSALCDAPLQRGILRKYNTYEKLGDHTDPANAVLVTKG